MSLHHTLLCLAPGSCREFHCSIRRSPRPEIWMLLDYLSQNVSVVGSERSHA